MVVGPCNFNDKEKVKNGKKQSHPGRMGTIRMFSGERVLVLETSETQGEKSVP